MSTQQQGNSFFDRDYWTLAGVAFANVDVSIRTTSFIFQQRQFARSLLPGYEYAVRQKQPLEV